MRMTPASFLKFSIAVLSVVVLGFQGSVFAGGYYGHYYGGYGHGYGYGHSYGGYGGHGYGHGYDYGHHYGYGHYNIDPYYGYGPGLFGHIIGSHHYGYSRYREAPLAGETIVVRQPVPTQEAARNSCLQTREYQARVTIGGRSVDAYGTACLQPDGSWRRGPLTPEPGR